MGVETKSSRGGRPQTRRRGRRWLVVLAAINLVVVGLVAAPSQAQTVTCSATLSNQTITATVVVPIGSQCILNDVVVDGRMEVQDFADLFMNGSRVMGPLTGGSSSYVEVIESRVDGMTSLNSSTGLVTRDSRFSRLVDARDITILFSDGTTHWGGIRATGQADIAIRGAVVIGSVSTTGTDRSDLHDTAVFGPVTVTDARYGSVICHMGAALFVRVQQSGGQVHVGNAQTFANCGFNLMGSLTVNDNINADIRIAGNLIAGNLDCFGNDPAPHGTFNLVGGDRIGQCASLTPAPAPASMGIQEEQTAPRLDGIYAVILQRTGRIP